MKLANTVQGFDTMPETNLNNTEQMSKTATHGTCKFSIQSRIDRIGPQVDQAYNKSHIVSSQLMKKKFYSTDKNMLNHANFTSTQHEGIFNRSMEAMVSFRPEP